MSQYGAPVCIPANTDIQNTLALPALGIAANLVTTILAINASNNNLACVSAYITGSTVALGYIDALLLAAAVAPTGFATQANSFCLGRLSVAPINAGSIMVVPNIVFPPNWGIFLVSTIAGAAANTLEAGAAFSSV